MSTMAENEENKVLQEIKDTQENEENKDPQHAQDTPEFQETKPIRMWETPTEALSSDTIVQFTLAELSEVVREACTKAVKEHTLKLQEQFEYLRLQNAEFAKGLSSALQQIANLRAAVAAGTESVTYTRPANTPQTIPSSPFDDLNDLYPGRRSRRFRWGDC